MFQFFWCLKKYLTVKLMQLRFHCHAHAIFMAFLHLPGIFDNITHPEVNLEPTDAEEAAELLAAAVMGLNDPEVRRSNIGLGVSWSKFAPYFSVLDSSKLSVKKLGR